MVPYTTTAILHMHAVVVVQFAQDHCFTLVALLYSVWSVSKNTGPFPLIDTYAFGAFLFVCKQ